MEGKLVAVLTVLLGSCVFLGAAQDEPGAIWMPSPHKNTGRGGHGPKWLILHGTAGGSSAEAIGEWFQNPDAQAATHYVVGQDGHVVQCVDEADTAWGNGRIEAGADPWWGSNPSPNQATISIEHVKASTDNSNELTAAQTAASFALIRNILNRNPSIKSVWADGQGGLTGHFSMSPGSRERCPGPFPWEALFTHLNGATKPICIGTITADVLNVRAEPNSGSPVVATLPNARVVNVQSRVVGEVVGGNNGWFLLENGSGYIAAYYVNVHINQPSWCQ